MTASLDRTAAEAFRPKRNASEAEAELLPRTGAQSETDSCTRQKRSFCNEPMPTAAVRAARMR